LGDIVGGIGLAVQSTLRAQSRRAVHAIRNTGQGQFVGKDPKLSCTLCTASRAARSGAGPRAFRVVAEIARLSTQAGHCPRTKVNSCSLHLEAGDLGNGMVVVGAGLAINRCLQYTTSKVETNHCSKALACFVLRSPLTPCKPPKLPALASRGYSTVWGAPHDDDIALP
jgi:hypothetical protein